MKIAVDWDNTIVNQNYGKHHPMVNLGFASFIDLCEKNGHEFYILTARKPKYNPEIVSILKLNYVSEDIPIINVDPERPQEKLLFDWDVLLDDNHKIFQAFWMLNKEKNKMMYLFDAKWNRHVATPYRVKDFYDFINFLA